MIRFPRMHIAQSVENRIKNLFADMAPPDLPPPHVPNVPDASLAGAVVDAGVTTPMAPMAAPVDAEATALAENLEGGSAASALATQGIIDQMT